MTRLKNVDLNSALETTYFRTSTVNLVNLLSPILLQRDGNPWQNQIKIINQNMLSRSISKVKIPRKISVG